MATPDPPPDPWAGKSLGEASAPSGFEEFWAQQLRHAEGRGPRPAEREADVRAGGPPSRRGRGRGPRRYNVPAPRAPRARPTHFVAVRLYSRMVRRNVKQMQHWFIDRDPLFEKCIVPVQKLHSSLLLTSIPQERRHEAREACHEAGNEIRAFVGDQPMKLVCSGVGSFNGNVLFARIRTEPHEMLQAIHDALSRSFTKHGFPVLDESAKSWLADGEGPHSFKAHASFIKTSKALVRADESDKRKLRSLRVTSDDLAAWKDVFFGSQLCHDFELLDMVGSTRDGYYPCIQLERFHDRPLGTVMAAVGGTRPDPSWTPLAAGPLRTARLRVECGAAGAGLELVPCVAGYIIERLLEWPGQPDLREGDVIVGIGGELLLGLDEEQLEGRFGAAFADGAVVAVGPWEVLQAAGPRCVHAAAERLFRPWRPLNPEPGALARVGRGTAETTEASEAASMYTEGGTRLKGYRYQLRTAAASFAPDPLSQPGGDPWAEAANAGYVYPEYTGWGTDFKTRKATRLDSSCFVRRPLPTDQHFNADGSCEGTEQAPIHRQLRSELRASRSHAHVLEVASRHRALLSLANRAAALARLAACGWLLDSLRGDEQLQALLADLGEDLEAAEEACTGVAPALLSSLALALGCLGLRHPELFRLLAGHVRRAGIWTFADQEVAALLEGFSRGRLTDEVIFQDVARLVVARIRRLAPQTLTTMLTAFACSNIATEHLFFVAGDHIVARLRDFSTSLLAELADAFSRVRARHALLLEVLPAHFPEPCLMDRKRCSTEALAKLLSAYVDTRLDFGPEGLRESLAEALCKRGAELSSRLMRQVLQAAARARWPHARLLELAAEVAVRDPRERELEAMHDCFEQLRVIPPASFPASHERTTRKEEQRRRRAEKRDAVDAAWISNRGMEGTTAPSHSGSVEGPAQDSAAELKPSAAVQLRVATLHVDPDFGAGIEAFTCCGGYIIDQLSNPPQQHDLFPGDLILAIEGRLLVGLEEEEVEQSFGDNFRHGARLVVGRLEHLQQMPLKELRQLAEELLQPDMRKGQADCHQDCLASKYSSSIDSGKCAKSAEALPQHRAFSQDQADEDATALISSARTRVSADTTDCSTQKDAGRALQSLYTKGRRNPASKALRVWRPKAASGSC